MRVLLFPLLFGFAFSPLSLAATKKDNFPKCALELIQIVEKAKGKKSIHEITVAQNMERLELIKAMIEEEIGVDLNYTSLIEWEETVNAHFRDKQNRLALTIKNHVLSLFNYGEETIPLAEVSLKKTGLTEFDKIFSEFPNGEISMETHRNFSSISFELDPAIGERMLVFKDLLNPKKFFSIKESKLKQLLKPNKDKPYEILEVYVNFNSFEYVITHGFDLLNILNGKFIYQIKKMSTIPGSEDPVVVTFLD